VRNDEVIPLPAATWLHDAIHAAPEAVQLFVPITLMPLRSSVTASASASISVAKDQTTTPSRTPRIVVSLRRHRRAAGSVRRARVGAAYLAAFARLRASAEARRRCGVAGAGRPALGPAARAHRSVWDGVPPM
jgi:hypothetical protein